MTLPRRAAALALVAVVGAGCSLPGASLPPEPTEGPSPSASPTPTPGPTASPTPGAGQLDLTLPGAARDLVTKILDAAKSSQALMVTVTATDATVTTLEAGQAHTWAWRNGRIQEVPTDITYVAQRTFNPDDFAFDDLGALFRAAESVSGSKRDQRLQVVDYSGGLITMSVSTNPESRAVFFDRDGTLLPTLDFTSPWGLQKGFEDAVGERRVASVLGFGSAVGVYLDTPQRADGGIDRRQRTARTPVIVTPRTEGNAYALFDPRRVDPAVVWQVLDALQEEGDFTLDTPWSCVVDDRADLGTPRMYFTVGDRSFVTNLSGTVIRG